MSQRTPKKKTPTKSLEEGPTGPGASSETKKRLEEVVHNRQSQNQNSASTSGQGSNDQVLPEQEQHQHQYTIRRESPTPPITEWSIPRDDGLDYGAAHQELRQNYVNLFGNGPVPEGCNPYAVGMLLGLEQSGYITLPPPPPQPHQSLLKHRNLHLHPSGLPASGSLSERQVLGFTPKTILQRRPSEKAQDKSSPKKTQYGQRGRPRIDGLANRMQALAQNAAQGDARNVNREGDYWFGGMRFVRMRDVDPATASVYVDASLLDASPVKQPSQVTHQTVHTEPRQLAEPPGNMNAPLQTFQAPPNQLSGSSDMGEQTPRPTHQGTFIDQNEVEQGYMDVDTTNQRIRIAHERKVNPEDIMILGGTIFQRVIGSEEMDEFHQGADNQPGTSSGAPRLQQRVQTGPSVFATPSEVVQENAPLQRPAVPLNPPQVRREDTLMQRLILCAAFIHQQRFANVIQDNVHPQGALPQDFATYPDPDSQPVRAADVDGHSSVDNDKSSRKRGNQSSAGTPSKKKKDDRSHHSSSDPDPDGQV